MGNSSSTEDCKNESLQMEYITFLIKEHIQFFMILVFLNNVTGHKHYANVCCGEKPLLTVTVCIWVDSNSTILWNSFLFIQIVFLFLWFPEKSKASARYELRCETLCTLKSFTYYEVNLKAKKTVNYILPLI